MAPGKASNYRPENIKVYERQPEKVKGLNVNRKISVPALHSEKINTPAYANYYQVVRERIKQRAYLNYSQLVDGEVYLTFIVSADGNIGQVKIIEEKTSANEYLRNVVLKSVRESNPFPIFPKDLKYPELTFNVIISFQVSE